MMRETQWINIDIVICVLLLDTFILNLRSNLIWAKLNKLSHFSHIHIHKETIEWNSLNLKEKQLCSKKNQIGNINITGVFVVGWAQINSFVTE